MKTQVKYNIVEDTFHIVSEVKRDKVQEVIELLLRSQIGAGGDDSEPNKHDIYIIDIDLELEDDTFDVSSNTGNKSLTTGILAKLVQELSNNSDKVSFV